MPVNALTPIPGDPAAVCAAAATFDAIAGSVAVTAARLRALATGGSLWTGTAAGNASVRAATLPPKLDKVQASYATAGRALRTYANLLADAQTRSASALRAATAAAADLASARAAQQTAAARDTQAARAATAAGQPPPTPTAPRFQADIDDANTRLARAQAASAAAHDDQSHAAITAAASLREASAAGIHNKHWWQRLGSEITHWATTAWNKSLKLVSVAATTISAIAGITALLVAVAGLVFPPLEAAAATLETISLIAGTIGAAADLTLAATGQGSWTAVAWDAAAIGPAIGAKLLRQAAPLLRDTKIIKTTTRLLTNTNKTEDTEASAVEVIDARGAEPGWLGNPVKEKVPAEWGSGSPTRKGTGWRWYDPDNRGNGIRIDKGNTAVSQSTQQVDHVVVNSDGRIVGRDGKPIEGSLKNSPTQAHIPLDEWLTWTDWYRR